VGLVDRFRSRGSGERSRAVGQGARASRRAAGRHVEPGLRSWFRVPCGEGPASVPDAGPSCAPARLRAGPHRRHERPAGGRILLRPHSAGPPAPVLTWGGASRTRCWPGVELFGGDGEEHGELSPSPSGGGGSGVVSAPGGQGRGGGPGLRSCSPGVGKSFHYDMEDTMKKGMNPEAVDQMSQQIQAAGEDALAAFTDVAGRVEGFDWTGEDRDRYVGELNGAMLALAQRVKQTCDEFAERGKQNAMKQRDASSS